MNTGTEGTETKNIAKETLKYMLFNNFEPNN
jgi:hypothetical protein